MLREGRVASVRIVSQSIGDLNGDLVVECLLVRLRVLLHGWRFNVFQRYCLLRSRLMHRNRNWIILLEDWLLRQRMCLGLGDIIESRLGDSLSVPGSPVDTCVGSGR